MRPKLGHITRILSGRKCVSTWDRLFFAVFEKDGAHLDEDLLWLQAFALREFLRIEFVDDLQH